MVFLEDSEDQQGEENNPPPPKNPAYSPKPAEQTFCPPAVRLQLTTRAELLASFQLHTKTTFFYCFRFGSVHHCMVKVFGDGVRPDVSV